VTPLALPTLHGRNFHEEIEWHPMADWRIKTFTDCQGLVAGFFEPDVVKPVPVVRNLDRRLAIIDTVDPHFGVGWIACDRECLSYATAEKYGRKHKEAKARNLVTASTFSFQAHHR
jgi:hypothetical protein